LEVVNCEPCRNPTTQALGGWPARSPITGTDLGCARTASCQAAAPPTSAMNARRFIRLSRRLERGIAQSLDGNFDLVSEHGREPRRRFTLLNCSKWRIPGLGRLRPASWERGFLTIFRCCAAKRGRSPLWRFVCNDHFTAPRCLARLRLRPPSHVEYPLNIADGSPPSSTHTI